MNEEARTLLEVIHEVMTDAKASMEELDAGEMIGHCVAFNTMSSMADHIVDAIEDDQEFRGIAYHIGCAKELLHAIATLLDTLDMHIYVAYDEIKAALYSKSDETQEKLDTEPPAEQKQRMLIRKPSEGGLLS